MRMSPDEIEKEVESITKILSALRSRRRVLREQAAQYGNMAPPHILTELDDITEQIHTVEQEADRLETQAVEDKVSLAEAEYLLDLAQVWATPKGYPTVEGFAKLEVMRLRLKIPPKRAKELEREIRASLAEERLALVDDISVFQIINRINDNDMNYRKFALFLKPLIFLHRETALKLFESYNCNWQEREVRIFYGSLVTESDRITRSIQGPILKSFVEVLKTRLTLSEEVSSSS